MATATVEFQSSPGLLAGCKAPHFRLVGDVYRVSILTRPSGRVQVGADRPNRRFSKVSILTRPSGRVQARGEGRIGWTFQVSILTRPSGRVQAALRSLYAPPVKFQSSPGLLAGCKLAFSKPSVSIITFQSSPGLLAGCKFGGFQVTEQGRIGFNPHPAFWPGATSGVGHFSRNSVVSILTRPSGRVQGGPIVPSSHNPLFQSSPGLLAGCKARAAGKAGDLARFQSSPGLLAGCKSRRPRPRRPSASSFNPHPAFWPGASNWTMVSRCHHIGFNPHPAFWPGARGVGLSTTYTNLQFQSSPGLLAGCKAPAWSWGSGTARPVSILTRPSGRVQAGWRTLT